MGESADYRRARLRHEEAQMTGGFRCRFGKSWRRSHMQGGDECLGPIYDVDMGFCGRAGRATLGRLRMHDAYARQGVRELVS